MRLNLGCGGDVKEGFVNIDLYSGVAGTVKMDIEHLPFQALSVDEIVAIDVIEHISHRTVKSVLGHWCSLLKPGGTITIRTPDCEKQASLLLDGTWDPEIFSFMVYGGQDSPGNFHKCAFSMQSISDDLKRSGMSITRADRLHNGITSNKNTSINPNLYLVAQKPK